jgi:flagellar basal-body rod protein FlgG
VELAPAARIAGPLTRGAGVTGIVALSSTRGELRATGEPLHVAIDGPGFLEVIRADGTPAYTRAGVLQINEDRMLATAEGTPLAAHIEIPPDASAIVIHPDGRVAVPVNETGGGGARGAHPGDEQVIGQLELVGFQNPSALQAAGANLYVAPPAAGEPQIAVPGESGMGTLRQGFVESSNVQLTDELVTLMLSQRAFELNARVVQAADQMLSITNSLPR